MLYKGGENKEDHGCRNMNCPARIEAVYYGNVKVRNGWWFSPGYALPFKHNNSWYCVEADDWDMKNGTYLKSITTYKRSSMIISTAVYGLKNDSKQETVWSIPYFALPVNEDFNREFDVLVSKFDRYLNKLVLLK
jgi:hypothetical protein